MSNAQADLVLQHIRRLAGVPHTAQPPDGQLLERFTAQRDEAAFAALVRRHGPMVLNVCRSVLRHEQDAEDAFQATFLALSRQAASLRRPEAVAGWLYEVAHRVAVKAQADAARRRAQERKASPLAPADPTLDMTVRDLHRVLHEELRRLPEKYRLPLVLCYLEGRSQAEAAAQLGWTKGAFRGRLVRGRERLRRRLAARGVALSALLGVTAVAPRVAAAALVDSAVELAIRSATSEAGAIALSTRAFALAEGVFGTTFFGKAKIATAVLLAAGLIAGGVALAQREPAEDTASKRPATAKPETPVAKVKPAVKERTITGRVLGSDGKPMAAELFLLWVAGSPESLGSTAADGTFQVTVPLKEPGAYLVAKAAGHGVDFMMPATNTPADVTFRLPKDIPIQGRVIDTQGRPVAGVELSVRGVQTFSKERLDRVLTAMQTRASHEPLPPGEWSLQVRRVASHTLPNGERLLAAKTDADGRFTISNVGADWTAWVEVRGGGIAEHRIVVVNREGFDPAPINRAMEEKRRRDGLGSRPRLVGPRPTIVAEAEKVIRGVVKEADTGRPRVGVRVSLDQYAYPQLPSLSAVTDAKGRYEIRGAKKAASYRLSVHRDTADVLLGRKVEVPDSTIGLEPQTADIGVAKGVLLTGRVLNVATGKPVPGFACVGILAGNTAVNSRPEYADPDCYDNVTTDAAGVFRTVVIPGRLLLMGGPNQWSENGQDESIKYKQQRIDPAYPEYFDKNYRASATRTAV